MIHMCRHDDPEPGHYWDGATGKDVSPDENPPYSLEVLCPTHFKELTAQDAAAGRGTMSWAEYMERLRLDVPGFEPIIISVGDDDESEML